MDYSYSLEFLKNIVAVQLGCELDQVEDNSNFIDDLGADSLDMAELIMRLEQELNLEIPQDEQDKISTVLDAHKYIISRLGIAV